MKTPVKSGRAALEALAPDVRLAVELYTNPVYAETFGNASRSCAAAGFSTAKPLYTPEAKAAIRYLNDFRGEQADKVQELLSRYSYDAAYRLIKLMSGDLVDGEPMKVYDPSELLEKDIVVEHVTDAKGNESVVELTGHLKRAREMTMHNQAVARLLKEARATVEMILQWHLGPPGQAKKGNGDEDPLDLGSLSLDQLQELMRQVEGVRDEKIAAQPKVTAVVVDDPVYTVEEDTEKGATPAEAKVTPKKASKAGLPF